MRTPPTEISEGVFRGAGALSLTGPAEMLLLAERLPGVARGRVRLCAHPDAEAALQEMFILLSRETYIRPHAHPGRPESLLVLEGEADAVFFDDAGRPTECVRLGDCRSGHPFYYRIETPVHHTLVLRTPRLLFHEATLGPFRPEATRLAPWAPPEEDLQASRAYRAALEAAVAEFRSRPGAAG